ncbi:hypothetical protein SAY86_025488 [Trapa natans]|uniref:Uncharacterized protein n=1 Tax=Trapa natans TaxID=22666 RepID=A0AAN7MXE4_TRANT|nr:hypothetical protein SAY86_025488 [Trapa natans]
MEHSRCCTVRQYPGYEAETTSDQVIEPLPVSNLPILGQIVRQKLSEGRKVTCHLLGVILEENTPSITLIFLLNLWMKSLFWSDSTLLTLFLEETSNYMIIYTRSPVGD